jgi:hypothetical protein
MGSRYRLEEELFMNMHNLESVFQEAKNAHAKYVGVLIEMEGFEKPEVIINSYENFDSKLEYYQKAYDENLNHKFSKGIRIIGCSFGNSFQEIEHVLIGLDQGNEKADQYEQEQDIAEDDVAEHGDTKEP